MASRAQDHKDVVRQEFTRVAETFAFTAGIVDPEKVARLIQAVNPAPDARVLEVAAGPGYPSLGFAAVCREVIAMDLTPALLEIGERLRRERGLENLRYQVGDAEHIPFGADQLDVVLCRFAFHHFPNPGRVLGEMARVCRPAGKVAIEDLVVSEHPQRAAYHNRMHALRDASHAQIWPVSELLRLFAASGLEVEQVQTNEPLQPLERWLASAQTPPEREQAIREMIERDLAQDLTVLRPYRQDGQVFFIERTVTIVGRKLARAAGE